MGPVTVSHDLSLYGCRGLRPQANAKGHNSVSSDLRCMALTGWDKGSLQQGSMQAHVITASSDATMSLLQFDLHTRRRVDQQPHVMYMCRERVLPVYMSRTICYCM